MTNLNEKVTLECITKTPRSVNPYNVKWFKDGVEITKEQAPHYTMFNYCNDENIDGSVLNFNKLVIQAPLTSADQGEYTVFIDDDLKSSAMLIIDTAGDVVFKPEIYVKKSQLQGFQNLVPVEQKDMIYTETITYQIDMPPDSTSKQSILSPISEKDDKTQQIQTTNKLIKIVKADDDLEFAKQLEPFMDCDEGTDCTLECRTNKYGTHGEWLKDERPLTSSPFGKYEITTSPDGRIHRLIIKATSPDDDKGIYTCRVNNYLQTNTILNVNEGTPLKIIRGLFDIHVPELERNLQLVVEMNKRIINDTQSYLIRWFVNKREIDEYNREYEISCVENKVFLKYLREILFDRDNAAQVEFRIQEFKSGVHNPELVSRCRLFVQKQQTARFFTKKLDNFMQADTGLPLDLEARVNFDAQLVQWYKNNSPISSDNPTFQIQNDSSNRLHLLRILNTKPRDSGIYSIDVDGLQCSSEVKIVDTPIKFVQRLKNQFYDLETDTSLTLDCQLNKPPSLFGLKARWFKNDIEIRANNVKYDLIEEHNICALIIYDLDERDEGKYACQIGTEKTECRIRPEYNLVKYLPNNIEPREGETCTLSFSVNRAPSGMYSSPVTKWFKDGHELPDDSRKYWFIEHGNERTLSIQECRPSDSGLYKAFIVDESDDSQVSLVTTNSCQVSVKKLKVTF